MIEPFKRENGFLVPVVNEGCKWFFNSPSIATREYEGILLRLTPGVKGYEGWQYRTSDGWTPIFPRQSMWQQIKSALKGQWAKVVTTFDYLEEFEGANLYWLCRDDYPCGEYWLFNDDAGDWWLLPVDEAEQISNINELEIYSVDDVEETFNAIQQAMAPLRDNVHGVIFTSGTHRARIRPSDFDWNNDE